MLGLSSLLIRSTSKTSLIRSFSEFHFQDMFEMAPDTTTKYQKITSDYVEECKVNI